MCYLEECYLSWDIVPIIVVWIVCSVMVLFVVAMWVFVCCKNPEEIRRGLKETYCSCNSCHCRHCKLLKCKDDLYSCECVDCTEEVEPQYKDCHIAVPKCTCNATAPTESSANCRLRAGHEQDHMHTTRVSVQCPHEVSADHDDTSGDPQDDVGYSESSTACVQCCLFEGMSSVDDDFDCRKKCEECPMSCFSKLVDPWSYFSFLLHLGDIVIQIVYGSSFQTLLRKYKLVTEDKLGNQKLYLSIFKKSKSLYFMLMLKAYVWLAFYLSIGSDLFFVQSELDCDVSRHCYILDGNYDEPPITNCTEVLNSKELTGVCYDLVFNYTMAIIAMGGLLTFTRKELSVLAAINIKILMCLKNKRICTIFWIVVQALGCLIGSVIIFALYTNYYLNTKTPKLSPLKLTGLCLNFLGILAMIVLSSMVPWSVIVHSNYVIIKIEQKKHMCLC